jgi:hypothetical protein
VTAKKRDRKHDRYFTRKKTDAVCQYEIIMTTFWYSSKVLYNQIFVDIVRLHVFDYKNQSACLEVLIMSYIFLVQIWIADSAGKLNSQI